MPKQTSVEWLLPNILELTLQLSNKRISQRNCELQMLKLFNQAKQMHKEEIIKAFGNKVSKTIKQGIDVYETISGEQYYNETYGGQDES
jgi:hypothetical protein